MDERGATMNQPALSDSERPLVVVLVHGTFAQAAEWTQPGSPLRESIQQASPLEVHFDQFGWNGRNTHEARISEGEKLLERLRDLRSKFADARIVVVAHSHGGNVLLYAGRDDAFASLVDEVITLATPYLEITPRDLRPYCWLLDACLHGLFLGPIFLVTVLLYQLLFGQPASETLAWFWPAVREWTPGLSTRLLVVLPASLIVGVLAGLTATSLANYFFWGGTFWFSPCEQLLLPRLLTKQDDVVARLKPGSPAVAKILVLAATGDEAGWLLRTLDALGNLPYMFLRLAALPTLVACSLFLVIYGIWDSIAGLLFWVFASNAYWRFLTEFALWSFIALLIASGFFLLYHGLILTLPNVRKIGFFGEPLAEYALAHIGISKKPYGMSCVMAQYDVRPSPPANPLARLLPRLKHSAIYDDPAVLSDLSEWLRVRRIPWRWGKAA